MATDTSSIKVETQQDNNNEIDKQLKDEKPISGVDEKMNQHGGDDSKNGATQDVSTDGNEEDLQDDQDENDEVEGDGEAEGEGENDASQDGANEESMDETNKTNLIVNYLPQNMTDEDFKELFTKFGAMKSCKIVRNRLNGHSYGFGFVDFETHEQALKAIEELNGHELEKKKIKVAFARPAGQDIKQANLYVRNIPSNWSQEDVRKAFESFGNIIQVRVLSDKNIAFVLYDLRKQAEMALESMQGKLLDGAAEKLEIKFAADKKNENKRGNRRGGRGSGGGDNGGGGGRNRERGNRGGVNRNNRNRSHSDSRNRSLSRGNRSQSSQRAGPGNRYSNGGMNNNSNNTNNNNFGPVRQQNNRMLRFTPYAPVQQQAPPMPQQAAQMAAYGYPSQQQHIYSPYMMQQQQPPMMQMNPPAATQPQLAAASMPTMAAYQMPAQIAPLGYGAAPAQSMSQMYNMASSTLQDAAQMQPQLGQPMNQSRVSSNSSNNNNNNNSSSSSNDGVTLFVYNIGPQSDEAELRSMFAPYGQVLRCNVVRKTPGGETKGFGFVTLKDRSQANTAISHLNGSPRNGKTLQVSYKK